MDEGVEGSEDIDKRIDEIERELERLAAFLGGIADKDGPDADYVRKMRETRGEQLRNLKRRRGR